jgi:hypothetical protein
VVAALWEANDVSMGQLMDKFYHELNSGKSRYGSSPCQTFPAPFRHCLRQAFLLGAVSALLRIVTRLSGRALRVQGPLVAKSAMPLVVSTTNQQSPLPTVTNAAKVNAAVQPNAEAM